MFLRFFLWGLTAVWGLGPGCEGVELLTFRVVLKGLGLSETKRGTVVFGVWLWFFFFSQLGRVFDGPSARVIRVMTGYCQLQGS